MICGQDDAEPFVESTGFPVMLVIVVVVLAGVSILVYRTYCRKVVAGAHATATLCGCRRCGLCRLCGVIAARILTRLAVRRVCPVRNEERLYDLAPSCPATSHGRACVAGRGRLQGLCGFAQAGGGRGGRGGRGHVAAADGAGDPSRPVKLLLEGGGLGCCFVQTQLCLEYAAPIDFPSAPACMSCT